MTLNECFISQCRCTSVLLKAPSPCFKDLKEGNKLCGTVASFTLDKFKIDLSYNEKQCAGALPQTLWLTFVLDCDTLIPFSIYDILAFLEPKNFNCYTYTYVDSTELMEKCFGEINEILRRVTLELDRFLENGVDKNKLITAQRSSINKFYGDNILESGELIGGSADKLINMMIKAFHDSEVTEALSGAQGLFYKGKEDKALKKLKKAKFKSPYLENLYNHISAGGKAENISAVSKEASVKKGIVRQGGGGKGVLKIIGLSLLFSIPVSLVMILVFYIVCTVMFKDAILFTGFTENIFIMPFLGTSLSVALGATYYHRKKRRELFKNEKEDYSPDNTVGKILKYLTITAETLAILVIFTSVFSTTVFYRNSFKYSQADFPLSHNECSYDSVDFIGIIGDIKKPLTRQESYLVVRTKSGSTINLYNSTFLSAGKFKENSDFLKGKNISVKTFKTYEDYEKFN